MLLKALIKLLKLGDIAPGRDWLDERRAVYGHEQALDLLLILYDLTDSRLKLIDTFPARRSELADAQAVPIQHFESWIQAALELNKLRPQQRLLGWAD